MSLDAMEEIVTIERIPAEYLEKRATTTKVLESVFAGGDIEFDPESCLFRYRDTDGSKTDNTGVIVTVDQQVDSMKAAIKAYQMSSKEEYSVRWDPEGTGKFDIKKALQDVEKSTEEYLKKGEGKEGLRSKVRHCLRKFSDNAESFTLLLEFLPNDTYGSLICGGVSVILSAASKVGHAREGVLEALTDIPEILASAGIVDTMYKDYPRLQKAVSQLYVATLLALEYILSWFHQSAARKLWKAKEYDDTLATRIKNVEKCAKAVHEVAGLCQQQINIENNHMLRIFRLEEKNAHLISTQYLKENFSSLLNEHTTALKEFILSELYTVLTNTPGMQMLERRQSQLQIECNREPREPQYGRPLSIAKRLTGLETQPARKEISGNKLLKLLNTPFTQTAESDIRKCLGAEISYQEQDRVQSVIHSSKFKSFFSGNDSTVLLVHGNTGSPLDAYSSISFFSATLVQLIRGLGVPVIHFSCGFHQNSEPAIFNGPDGMMRALLQQLLSIDGKDLISLKKSTLKKLPESNKRTRKLVGDRLTKRRHKGVTFCIIDGISFFEIPKFEKRLKLALETLMKAVDDRSEGCGVVKLLITTPENSRCVPKMVGMERIFSVPDISNGTRQGLSREVIKGEVRQAMRGKKQRI